MHNLWAAQKGLGHCSTSCLAADSKGSAWATALPHVWQQTARDLHVPEHVIEKVPFPCVSISPIQRRRERDCQGSEARHSCMHWLLTWSALTTCCILLHAADNGREGHASYCSHPGSPSGYQAHMDIMYATCCSDCYAEQWAGSKNDVFRAPACRVSKRPVGRCRAMVRAWM